MTRKELLEQLGESEDGGIVGILPSVVLLDDQLPVSARLLYGVITWRCGRTNACTWASNKELGQDIGLTAKRVSELVLLLQQRGHVETEIERDEETGEILRRLIYPQMQSGRGIPKNTDTLSRNFGGGIPKNTEILRKKKKEIEKDIPPIIPPKKSKRSKTPPEPDWLPERFEKFWQFYPHDYRGNKQKARRAWNKLQPDGMTLKAMAYALQRHMQSNRWQEGIGIPNASTYINPDNGFWELADAHELPEPVAPAGRFETVVESRFEKL